VLHTINGLAIEDAALDFGAVWVRPDFTHTLTIHNQRSAPTEIQDFRASCGCISIEPRTLKIPARGSAEVRVAVDLTPRQAYEVAQTDRPFAVEIRPIWGG
jgi:hypothetical protein